MFIPLPSKKEHSSKRLGIQLEDVRCIANPANLTKILSKFKVRRIPDASISITLRITHQEKIHSKLETVSIAEPLQNRQHARLMLSTLEHKGKREG